MRRLLVLSAALLAALGARSALAQPLDYVQGPYGLGGTWNVYEYVPAAAGELTWWDADDAANGMKYAGVTGHLVDILSADENAWLNFVGDYSQTWWIGLTDREGAAPAATSGGLSAPRESEGLANDRTQGWAWTSGKPYVYSNWNTGEPNDAGGEDAVEMPTNGLWNDNKGGFGANQPKVPVLRPGTSTDEATNLTHGYIVEYPLQSATMIAGVDAPGFPSMCPILPGATGVNGQMAVTDFYGGLGTVSGLANVCTIIDDINSGNVEPDVVAVKQYRISDVTDPDTNVAGGPVLGGTPLPYPSDTPEDDNDFISIAKGTFTVPQAGTYTIQVRSDDGMAFRVNGTAFTSVYGGGIKDQNGAMIFPADTGDANTRGVITLAAGEHNFEFLMWERGGGAFWEITKTSGAPDVTASPTTRWSPLVDLDHVAVGAMPKDLPGVDGGEGTVGVTDFYDLGQQVSGLGNAAALIERIKSGDLDPEVASDQFTISAARDPDTNGGTTILGGAAPAFPSDTAGDNDDFISVARGR